MMTEYEPGYLTLDRSGELARRAEALEARLAACDICPRACGVNRQRNRRGFCHSGRLPIVATACAHHGEEPALSGTRGSGTIFFGNCNMRCVYCQNHQISQDWLNQRANEITPEDLAGRMLHLQDGLGCHNINLVSPSHFVPQIVRALTVAIPRGLRIPLVYNTGGYDSLATVQALDGIVDIYLPDLRYASDSAARRFSRAPDYVARARAAIKEMYRQTGNLVTDEAGVARRGTIVRLLILPAGLAGTPESLAWLADEVSPAVTVSVMAQYYPMHKARQIPQLARKITPTEYATVTAALERLGMENGWVQEMDAPESYLPDFTRQDAPFLTG